MNTQKQRYKIGNIDLEILSREIKDFVESGEYPKSDYQKDRPVITRGSCLLPVALINYFRKNYLRRN